MADSRVRTRKRVRVATLCAAAVVVAVAVPQALAVTVQAGPTTTLSSYNAAATGVVYTFAQYRTGINERVTGWAFTFPAGTNVSGAISSGRAGTVAVNGQTVRVTFTTPIARSTNFSVALGGIGNPVIPGTYNSPPATITFYTTNQSGGNPTTSSAATAAYTIVAAPGYISMTITTPGTPQTVAFGSIDPGTTSAPASVQVAVTSSGPYTISRTLGGATALMGLSVAGSATGAKPAGAGTYTDTYTINIPWTTDPGVALAATVQYTVTQ
jgi:hypothetical protein